MTRLIGTSWSNPDHPCHQCHNPAGTDCDDQCPAAINLELTDEHDLRIEATYERGAA